VEQQPTKEYITLRSIQKLFPEVPSEVDTHEAQSTNLAQRF